MTEVVEILHYRLVRPDGTVLWSVFLPSDLGHIPVPPISPSSSLRGGEYAGAYALPPWRYECAVAGTGEWQLIEERS